MEDDAQNRKTYNFAYEILVSWNWSIENGILSNVACQLFGFVLLLFIKMLFHLLYSVTQKVCATHFERIEQNLSSAIHLKPILAMRMFTPHRIAHHSKYIAYVAQIERRKKQQPETNNQFSNTFFQIFHYKNVIVNITDGR